MQNSYFITSFVYWQLFKAVVCFHEVARSIGSNETTRNNGCHFVTTFLKVNNLRIKHI